MRQFVILNSVAAEGTLVENLSAGVGGFAYINSNGKLATTRTATNIKKKGYFVVGQNKKYGGPIILPFYKNNFSYSFGTYAVGQRFSAALQMPTPEEGEEYTLIIVKKGVKFNERNKWSVSYVAKKDDDADSLTEAFINLINSNSDSSGVKAEEDEGLVIYTEDEGVDYTVVGADALFGIDIDIQTGYPAFGDFKHISDLAAKAAADAGMEYTYQDDSSLLYPRFPLEKWLGNLDTSTTFDVLTMRFAEQREMKTVEDVVNQIIQIAINHGEGSSLITVCNALLG